MKRTEHIPSKSANTLAASNDAQTLRTPSTTPTRHMNQVELSLRWNISARTLERWRWIGQGPSFLKIGGRVVYRLADIEAYEAAQEHALTPPSPVSSDGRAK